MALEKLASKKSPSGRPSIFFWNTLSGKKEKFSSIKPNSVGMYNCGPTVYNFVHIGNLRSYIFADTIRRVLEWNGYKVKQVINITDVGHLTSDADIGPDKLEEGARREGRSVKDIVKMYTEAFFSDIEAVNIPQEKIIFPKATDHIAEQIAIVEKLIANGNAYKISDGVYFDTSTFPDYGKLGGGNSGVSDNANSDSEARIEKNIDKHHQSDFALWKFSKPEDKREQEWPSPWGVGFPGWHIECSAMSRKFLGETLDIHTGGVDHIPVHHNNEIAQSEAAFGKPLAHFWLHNAFVSLISGEKMAKSGKNFIRLKDLVERGISPLAFRYWLLTAHYRSQTEFSFEAVGAAQTAYNKLVRSVALLNSSHSTSASFASVLNIFNFRQKRERREVLQKFTEIINNDLNTSEAIAFVWQILKDNKNLEVISKMDEVLGLGIIKNAEILTNKILKTPSKIKELAYDREIARKRNDWATADSLRQKIEKAGYILEDGPNGSILLPK
ncbi:MAG: cysteine--tRNA ligase [Patescibacteria group bacterium]